MVIGIECICTPSCGIVCAFWGERNRNNAGINKDLRKNEAKENAKDTDR